MHLARQFLTILFCVVSTVCWAQGTQPSGGRGSATGAGSQATEPPAVALKRMREYLTATKDLEFTTNVRIADPVLGKTRSGKVHYVIRKPNLFRIVATQADQKLIIVSDGQTLTIDEVNNRSYRQYKARPTILETVNLASGLEVVQARMVEFLMNVEYAAEVQGSSKPSRLPSRQIGQRTCDGLGIKSGDNDWSVWLERTDARLPCLLISKRAGGFDKEVYTNTFVWVAKPNIAMDTFTFSPPKGHKKE